MSVLDISRYEDSEAGSDLHDTGEALAFRERRPWVRFWARSIDYGVTFFGLFVTMVILLLLGVTWVTRIPDLVLAIIAAFAWVFVEAMLLSTWGWTPGKWLLRISVRDADGEKLRFGDALKRTLDVFIWGDGLGIPLVSLITRIRAYSTLTNSGATSWDARGGYIVTHGKIGWVRIVISGGLLVGYFWVLVFLRMRAT